VLQIKPAPLAFGRTLI